MSAARRRRRRRRTEANIETVRVCVLPEGLMGPGEHRQIPGRRRAVLANAGPPRSGACGSSCRAFVVKWGDVSVELDALPIEVLRGRIVSEIESRMDLDALARATEVEERHHLTRALEAVGGHR
jgi:hypothetical protein